MVFGKVGKNAMVYSRSLSAGPLRGRAWGGLTKSLYNIKKFIFIISQ